MVYEVGRVIELLEYIHESRKWRHSTTRPFQRSRKTVTTCFCRNSMFKVRLASIWCIKRIINDAYQFLLRFSISRISCA